MSDQQGGDGGHGLPGYGDEGAAPQRRYGAERFAPAPAPAYGGPGYAPPYGAPGYGASPYGPPGYGPPPLPGGVGYASWGRRAAASIVDTLLVVACVLPGILVIGVGSAAVAPDSPVVPVVLGVVLVLAGLGLWLFNACWTQGTTGQSWGKRALGIHLVREDRFTAPGGGVGVARYAVRHALGNATFGVYTLVTFLWPLWDERNQTIDDKIVHTLVVRAERGASA